MTGVQTCALPICAAWRKRALKRLDQDYDARPIKQGGRVLGIRLANDQVICKKKSFGTEELAAASLEQIHRFRDTGHVKPTRAYQCLHCSFWHLTHWSTPPVNVDDGDES